VKNEDVSREHQLST